MKISVSRSQDGIIVVRLAKKFTLEEVMVFEAEIKRHMTGSFKVLAFDMSKVDFIDSSAIGTMMKIKNQVTFKGITLVLFDVPGVIMSTLRVAYLDRFFSIRTRDEFYSIYPTAPRDETPL